MAQTEETTHKYRWVILGVLWTTFIVVYLHRLSIGPLAPFFKEELGITNAQVGLVMSAAAFGYMVSMFPIGFVVDKIGARWLLIIGELIAGTSMIALFSVPSYLWLLILMFVVVAPFCRRGKEKDLSYRPIYTIMMGHGTATLLAFPNGIKGYVIQVSSYATVPRRTCRHIH